MCSSRRPLLALGLALAACGGDHRNDDPGASVPYTLTLVGSASLVLHPNDQRTLQVLLAQDQVGPVANAGVHFEFQDGDPAGATLDAQDVQTDEAGVATVDLTAGESAAGRPAFKLVASAQRARPVAFSFHVIPVRRMLQIVASPATRVAADGASATVDIGANNTVPLKVRELDADTGAGIAQDDITFALSPAAEVAGLSWSAGTPETVSTTGAGGEAQAFLFTGGAAGGPWPITAVAGGAAVTFSVSVQSSGGGSCSTNLQCPTGQVCAGDPPTCQDAGGAPPSGNACDPNALSCGTSQCCDGATSTCTDLCPGGCAAGTHCEPGATCGAGTCLPDLTTPDVTGLWLTRHDFSIREALPTALQDVFYAIRVIDQALLGKLTISWLPGWLQSIIDSFVSKLLQQYLPGWLQQIIHISDDVVTVLSNLRAEGSMHLVKGVDYAHLNGTETWSSLVFYWLPLCNGAIGGDPAVPPECARVDIATTDAANPAEAAQCKGQSLPSITVQVAPFTATVAGSGPGGTSAPFSLNVDNSRQVRLQMGKVLLVLVDTILSSVTQYQCIEEITACTAGPGNCPLVDCYGLSQDLAGPGTWLGKAISPGTIEGLCDGAVTVAGQAATRLLANAWSPTADVLDFTGRATVSGSAGASSCEGGGATCAAQLGNDSWDRDLNTDSRRAARDGSWSGDFFFKLVHKLPGAWQATRPQ